jgi:eukaryotic-like serine/threonine-protein kinase
MKSTVENGAHPVTAGAPPTPEPLPPSPPAPAATDPRALDVGHLTGHLLDGRYRMVKKIGEGGMCLVYLARDSTTGDTVAIKILLPALINDPTSMARLRREAALGGQLAHRNVCHIIRLGETAAGFDYIVMPYVEGDLLCDRTARAGHLPLATTAAFVRDMCAGLQVAHELGIIHRDLKPENIMIVADPDGSERAVVMDFSLATVVLMGPEMQKLTAAGLVVGTPEFMSPEQLRGEEIDRRSDIYSLAFMVYEMLTGQLPFEGRTPPEIMIARLKGASIPIRAKRPDLDIPAPVERVLNRALAPDAERRYSTAREFGEAFSRAAAGEDPEGGGIWRRIRAAIGY